MNSDPEHDDLLRIRHSAAHVMAQAVLERFPEGKLAIGPPIQDGFYYDFDLPRPLTPEDVEEIEARMREILSEEHEFELAEITPEEARDRFRDQPFKLELIDDILERRTDEYGEPLPPGKLPKLTTYRHSTFEDLCRGPHVASTSAIPPEGVKLLSVAAAYWRGDSTRPVLQRIYGTAWPTAADLEGYLHRLEEARKRDHRNVGKALDLFSTSEVVGPGLILWHPKGAMVRFLAESFSQQAHLLNGYEWVYTPHIGRSVLWETSGHLQFFQDSMYSPMDVEGDQYFIKPMNCPFHIQIYRSRPRSYRELPKRFAEYGGVYRYELSGTLHGLTRVRGFTQDDAHIFCLPEQVGEEIHHALRFSLYVLRTFGLEEFKAYIATRPPEKAIGAPEEWDRAVGTLVEAVEQEGIPFEIDEGGGAFYGPKIDLKVQDALLREWQLSTIQFDFNLPERFELEYVGPDGNPHRPYMVHRALFGSAERFLGLLVEHYAGAFPLWLAPVQVVLIPITDRHLEYARQVRDRLHGEGIRVRIDDGDARMQAKIREAQLEKIPYAFVLGNREAESGRVSVRCRQQGDLGGMSIEEFLELTAQERARGIPRPVR